MIDIALNVLKNCIRDYLIRLPNLNITSEEPIVLDHFVEHDGTIAIPPNTLGLSLVNVEEERVIKSQKAFFKAPDGRVAHVNPEIKLNLYTVIAANFSTYKTGLEFLSAVIRFFQSKNVFTPENTPELDPSIQKLIVELYTLNFEQQNHLWGSLGAKYMPSVMYKAHLLAIQEAHAADDQPPISVINFSDKSI
jgi:hypothetical protein